VLANGSYQSNPPFVEIFADDGFALKVGRPALNPPENDERRLLGQAACHLNGRD